MNRQEGARAARLQELKDITTTLQSLDKHERSRTLEETQKLLDSAKLEDVPAEPVTADGTQAIQGLEDAEVSSERLGLAEDGSPESIEEITPDKITKAETADDTEAVQDFEGEEVPSERQVMVEDKRPKIIEEITPDKITKAETADAAGSVQQLKDEEVLAEREEMAQEEVSEVKEETPDKTTTVYIDPTLAPATAPLSARFAQLTLAMQATAISEAPTLSKRQHAIAQAEAKAFTQALMPVEESASDLEDAEAEEDPLQVLQAALHESSLISEEYERRSQPIRKETYTDCMVRSGLVTSRLLSE